MTNKEFLKEYPLEVWITKSEREVIESVLNELLQSFSFRYTISRVDDLPLKGYQLTVFAKTTNFALTYFAIGRAIEKINSQ